MSRKNDTGSPDRGSPDHSDGPGWTEHTPRATADINISVAYANPQTDELMAFYAAWADSYDADLIDAYGYMAPADAVTALIAPDLPGGALAKGRGSSMPGAAPVRPAPLLLAAG